MHQVAEKLIKTEAGSLGVISKKKTATMDDVRALQLVTSKRFEEEERARYKQERSRKPGEQQIVSGVKRLGDAEVGVDADEEIDTVVGKLATDLVAASIAGLLKGERVNAEVRQHLRHRWTRTIQQLLFGALSSASQSRRKTVTPMPTW